MAEYSYSYDPQLDIAPVDQFGFVDLHDAFVNHTIPGDLSVSADEYNGVDDPSSLIGRPTDVFDALRKAEYVRSQESSAAAKVPAAKAAEAAAASSEGAVAE